MIFGDVLMQDFYRVIIINGIKMLKSSHEVIMIGNMVLHVGYVKDELVRYSVNVNVDVVFTARQHSLLC